MLHTAETSFASCCAVTDLMKNVKGSLQELSNLQAMTDVINKKQLEDVLQNIKVDTKVLVDASAVAERGSKSLEVMQAVLASSMAFDLIDRFTAFNMNIDSSVPSWMVWFRDHAIYPPGAWLLFNMLFGAIPIEFTSTPANPILHTVRLTGLHWLLQAFSRSSMA